VEEAAQEAAQAQTMAARYGSVRQRRRLQAVLARVESQVVQKADEGA
jgi:hypothetical protein